MRRVLGVFALVALASLASFEAQGVCLFPCEDDEVQCEDARSCPCCIGVRVEPAALGTITPPPPMTSGTMEASSPRPCRPDPLEILHVPKPRPA